MEISAAAVLAAVLIVMWAYKLSTD